MPTTQDGLRINYQVRGAGTPVLFIHGFSASGRMWPESLLNDIAQHAQLITFDARGTGDSAQSEAAYDATHLAADAIAVLDACRVKSAVLLGYSMGGMIAQQIALDHPERVRALALVSTASGGPTTVLDGDRMAPLFAGGEPRDAIRSFWSGIAAPGFGDAHPAILDELVDAALSAPTPPETLGAQGAIIQSFDSTPRLAQLEVTTRILHGEADPLNDVGNAERLTAAISGSTLTRVPEVGHMLPWEAPEALLATVRELL